MKRVSIGFLVCMFLTPLAPSQETIDAKTLVSRSIGYHDPEGLFLTQSNKLVIEEERSDEDPRGVTVIVDVAMNHFELIRRDEHEIAGVIDGDVCKMTIDGRSDLTPEEQQASQIYCERIKLFRDYYTYLWGLPMKLNDPGTHLGDPFKDRFNENDVIGLRVSYDEAVGGDIWYVYFDPQSYAMVGYRFYHDEEKGDGEYIQLDGETEGKGLRLPKNRRWLTHQGDQWLGTDHLLRIE